MSDKINFTRGETYVWNRSTGEMRRATWRESLAFTVRHKLSDWTRWSRIRTVVRAIDKAAGRVTLTRERWSWRRWRWERVE